MTLLEAKGLFVAAAALAVFVCASAAAAAEVPPLREPNRPQFHFTPAKNWLNDPNGLVYFGDEWHLFYQYNPEGIESANKSWGHAVSRDLLHWEHLPLAIRYGEGLEIWSGSAVVDRGNTSGFGTTDNPPLVALYTSAGHGKQTQSLAYSTDRGRTWTKFAGNPVIDENLKDFRDPKVAWHEPTQRWVMAVALPVDRKVRFYGSKDLKAWNNLGEFGPAGATEGVWECPDLFELPVHETSGAATQKKPWVLAVSVSGGAPAGANGCQYFVGDFDGKTFRSANPNETVLWADHGPDYYAPQSWSDVPAVDGRRIWLGWMTNFRYAGDEPTKAWRGGLSLPRELRLVETPGGLRLAQSPVRELMKLRAEKVHPGDAMKIGPPLEFERTLERTQSMSFQLASGGGEPASAVTIGFDAEKQEVYVDRKAVRPGKPLHPEFEARYTAPVLTRSDRPISLRVFVDRTSVEVFADDGLSVLTVNTFADPPLKRLFVPNIAPVTNIWRLNSIWNPKE